MARKSPFDFTVEKLKKRLDGGDDARASKHVAIAKVYLDAGDRASAAEWYLKAATHAEFSELALLPLIYARRAVELVPEHAHGLEEVQRLEKKYGVRGRETP
jgi:hypothetical protein